MTNATLQNIWMKSFTYYSKYKTVMLEERIPGLMENTTAIQRIRNSGQTSKLDKNQIVGLYRSRQILRTGEICIIRTIDMISSSMATIYNSYKVSRVLLK